jgi:hypothetical protein
MPPPFPALFNLIQVPYGSLGFRGTVGLAILLVLLYCLQDWDNLEKRLFSKVRLGGGKLPESDPEKLSIGVLLIEHDEHHEIGDVIAQALSPFSGVHVARLEQTIGTQDPDWGHLLATAQKRA